MTVVPIRHSLRHRIEPRGTTTRRLAAANRALKKERDRRPLFAEQIAAEQPSPEQRIEDADRCLLDYDQAHRDLAAAHWRRGRRWLSAIPADVRAEIVDLWNRKTCPPTAAYFCDFVRRELKRRGLPFADDA